MKNHPNSVHEQLWNIKQNQQEARGEAGRHGRKSVSNKCARSERWYSVARAISRTSLRISQRMWLREAPNLGRGGARIWRSYFTFCVKRFCECSNCTVSSGLCAGRVHSLLLLWAQKCQKGPGSITVSKFPVRSICSIVLHNNGSTTTRRMTSRPSRKRNIKERSGTASHCEIECFWKES